MAPPLIGEKFRDSPQHGALPSLRRQTLEQPPASLPTNPFDLIFRSHLDLAQTGELRKHSRHSNRHLDTARVLDSAEASFSVVVEHDEYDVHHGPVSQGSPRAAVETTSAPQSVRIDTGWRRKGLPRAAPFSLRSLIPLPTQTHAHSISPNCTEYDKQNYKTTTESCKRRIDDPPPTIAGGLRKSRISAAHTA